MTLLKYSTTKAIEFLVNLSAADIIGRQSKPHEEEYLLNTKIRQRTTNINNYTGNMEKIQLNGAIVYNKIEKSKDNSKSNGKRPAMIMLIG